LRSMTQGRGVYSIEFDHYDPVPAQLVDGIVAAFKMEQEEVN
jgi:elongation factor G